MPSVQVWFAKEWSCVALHLAPCRDRFAPASSQLARVPSQGSSDGPVGVKVLSHLTATQADNLMVM